MAESAAAAYPRVAAITARLSCTDLRPGAVVDSLFRQLVAMVETIRPEDPVLACPRTQALVQGLCARGEALLEEHWSARIVAAPNCLAEFPYAENYRSLVRAEHAALRAMLGRSPRRLVFVGSGPLPLTAILLTRQDPTMSITCVDRDEKALAAGERTARALRAPSSALRFVLADGEAADYSRADAVVLAALAGQAPAEKKRILDQVASSVGREAQVVARSVPADGRQLLYPRIEPSSVPDRLEIVGETSPPPGVINSLVLMRPARGALRGEGSGG